MTQYIFLSREQDAGPIHDVKVGSEYFEIVAEFRHLRTTLTNQNYIHEETKT